MEVVEGPGFLYCDRKDEEVEEEAAGWVGLAETMAHQVAQALEAPGLRPMSPRQSQTKFYLIRELLQEFPVEWERPQVADAPGARRRIVGQKLEAVELQESEVDRDDENDF